jgi:peroxiredoxin Q/BCP
VRDHRQEFDQLGVDVVGISPDEPDKQLAFDEKYQLGFPLLADTDHAVAEAWGTWKDDDIVRSSFLVDEEGRIQDVWYRVKPVDTVPKAKQALAA